MAGGGFDCRRRTVGALRKPQRLSCRSNGDQAKRGEHVIKPLNPLGAENAGSNADIQPANQNRASGSLEITFRDIRFRLMRTTLTMDDDVAAVLQREAKQKGMFFKALVNAA